MVADHAYWLSNGPHDDRRRRARSMHFSHGFGKSAIPPVSATKAGRRCAEPVARLIDPYPYTSQYEDLG